MAGSDSADEVTGDALPEPDAVCDGGDLDCGSGLLLIIRKAMTPLDPGGILEVRSRESSVREDLPAWCRMVGHTLVASAPAENRYTHYAIAKKGADRELSGDLEEARNFRWRVRARWHEGMQAKVFVRNHTVVVGQPASFDTEDAAPSAVEVLLSSLAGCLAVGFQWRLSQRGIEVHDLEVSLSSGCDNILVFLGVEEEGHPGLAGIEGKLFVDAEAEPEVLEEVWRETLNRSPVAQSLVRSIPVTVEVRKA